MILHLLQWLAVLAAAFFAGKTGASHTGLRRKRERSMKITFLGTGAADFLPSLADTDRFTVSRDIRRCTVTLLGEDIGMWAGTVFHAQTHLAEKP